MQKVSLDKIIVSQRKRRLDIGKVQELANSIAEIGLLHPIVVSTDNHLVSGYHRLEAAKLLGWDSIAFNIFEGDTLDSELAEIDENLRRNDLTVLEQGEHLFRRNEILEERGLRRSVGGDGSNQFKSNGVTVTPLQTTEDIAEEAGLSKSTTKQRVQIARDIDSETKDRIRDLPLADSTTQLLELARMNFKDQRQVVDLIVDGTAKNVETAKYQLDKKRGRLDDPLGLSKPGRDLTPLMSSASNEWYTTPDIIDVVRRVMGSIDLDPASCEEAQKNVGAKQYFTINDDGLKQEWHGNVFINPPYGSEIPKWVDKMIDEYKIGNAQQCIMLVPSRTDTRWYRALREYPRCHMHGRVRFNNHENSAPFPTMLVGLGVELNSFIEIMEELGDVYQWVTISGNN